MTLTLIQAIRGLASACVVLMHIKIFLTKDGIPGFFSLVPNQLGAIPCMFFAVSGYFMAMLLDRRDHHFLANRFVRIYPTYFGMIAVAYLVRLACRIPFDLYNLPLVMSLLPFGPGLDYKLGIEWTLIYEILFYFICAYYCRPGMHDLFPRMLIAWYLLLMAAVFVVNVPLMPNAINIWASPWNANFVSGALIYHFMRSLKKPSSWFWLVVLAVATVATYHFSTSERARIIVLCGAIATAILAGVVVLERWVRAPLILERLGDYSYVLYLFHVTVIVSTFSVYTRLTGNPPGPAMGTLALVLAVAASWPLGRADVALHKRLKGKLKRYLNAREAAKAGATAAAQSVTPGVAVELNRPLGPSD